MQMAKVLIFEMMALIFVISTLSAGAIMLADKLNLISWYENKRATSKLSSWMPPTCLYCLGFWLSLITFVISFFLSYHDLAWYNSVVCSFACSSVVQKLLR